VARRLSYSGLISIFLFGASPALGEWSHDPFVSTPICQTIYDQRNPLTVADGTGGCYVVWEDDRSGNWQLYAQRMDAAGNRLWNSQGIQVCTGPGDQTEAAITLYEGGGFVVVWQDTRGAVTDVYAQYVDSLGAVQWAVDGAPVTSPSSYTKDDPVLTPGEDGGVIIAWVDNGGTNGRVKAQRLDATGDIDWWSSGATISGACVDPDNPAIVTDGDGGAIIVWEDSRAGFTEIYAYRVDGMGEPGWEDGEVLASSGGTNFDSPSVIPDNEGGLLIGMRAEYSGEVGMILQKLDVEGGFCWSAYGVWMDTGYTADVYGPRIASDDADGAFVAWEHESGYGCEVYLQRVHANGMLPWGPEATALGGFTAYRGKARIVRDGSGGVVVAWKYAPPGSSYVLVAAERVDALGHEVWDTATEHVLLGLITGATFDLIDDETGGCIAVWSHSEDSDSDVVGQRLDRSGHLGHPHPTLTSVTDYPNDQGGRVIVGWDASYLDAWPWHAVDYYSVWMREPGSRAPEPIGHAIDWPEAGRYARDGWSFAAQVPATLMETYSCFAPTFGDSTSEGIPWVEYLVIAHGSEPWMFWESGVLAGYSVDNIAPGAPLDLAGEPELPEGVRLTWTASGHHDEDLSHYLVYRGEEAGFPLDAAHRIGSTIHETYLDPVVSGVWFYRTTAVDVHENEGEGSNEAMVSLTSDAPQPPPAGIAIRSIQPNPFTHSATISLSLPAPGAASVKIYDVDGQCVMNMLDAALPAGEHQFSWDGRDASGRQLPSGPYFVRIQADEESEFQRLILLR